MEKLKSENKICLACMEQHDVDIVKVIDNEIFKDEEVEFPAVYEYCLKADEYLENEEMIRANSLAMKDAYREKMGLLTSNEIRNIREKYGVSQKDFSEVLDWGRSTITRYENHQVQDRAHDDVLRKIDADPKWFLEKLESAKGKIPEKAFLKYKNEAKEQFKKKKNQYLIDFIYATHANIDDEMARGRVELNLDKVVEMINYLAAKVNSLHKVKLMKMLWYADALHYKRNGKGISGLAYNALPMGAAPEAYDQIVSLDGVEYDTVPYEENIGYKFKPAPGFEVKELTQPEIETLDKVISEFGQLKTGDIVEIMHNEEAYKCTKSNDIISYSFAEKLSID
ncbi:MAG: DUF4065 domain-containing protein [Clostridiales bacterium]|nr:DUF4065 domain-containing protein [Clostridiales bacterium]